MDEDNVVPFLDFRKNSCKEKHGGHKGPFLVDEWTNTVLCKSCNAEINAIKFLIQFATGEKRMYKNIIELHDRCDALLKKCKDLNRTKCEHCHAMTRIDKTWV